MCKDIALLLLTWSSLICAASCAIARLPPDTRPISYDWSVRIHLPHPNGFGPSGDKLFTVEGCVDIHIECLKSTDRVVLSQIGISVTKSDIRLSDAAGSPPACNIDETPSSANGVAPEEIRMDNDKEMLYITFGKGKQLQAGKEYRLRLVYSAPVAEAPLRGIYRSHYRDEAGAQRWLSGTHMEPVGARRALPLYDEPQLKAVFRVTIQHPAYTHALSNAPTAAEPRRIDADWLETRFEPTPKMSSYLLAIVVSDLVHREGAGAQDQNKIRIWCRPALVNDTRFIETVAPKLLDYFAEFYKMPYTLKKLDMVALPDSIPRAMENWGLIHYREPYLLYNKEKDSMVHKKEVTHIAAHELAHQWFGNIVTMMWWDDLWLNEGFAHYASYRAASSIDPKERMDDRLGIHEVIKAKAADQKITSHPLFVPIENHILENFDTVAYSKGCTIVRMVEYVMGIDNLQLGLQKYLTQYEYSNANNSHLWESLSKVDSVTKGWDGGKLDMVRFAETWTLQKNFPLVVVAQRTSTDGANQYDLRQEHFFIGEHTEEEPHKHSPFDYKWYIPVWYNTIDSSTGNSRSGNFAWMTIDGSPVQIGPMDKSDIPILNTNNVAFFRTLYPKEMYKDIANVLSNHHKEIDAQTKCMLLDDAFSLAEASKVPYANVLPLVEFFATETDNLVLMQTLEPMTKIVDKLRYTASYKNAKSYMRRLLKDKYNVHGWNSDDLDDLYVEDVRLTVTRLMCHYDDKKCLQKTSQIGQELLLECKNATLSKCNRMKSIYRATQYCGFVKTNANAFDYLWDRLKVEQSQTEIVNIIEGLSCSKDDTKIKQLLGGLIEGDVVKRHNVREVYKSVSKQYHGGRVAFDFLLDQWNAMTDKLGGVSMLRGAVDYGPSNIAERRQVDRLRAFLEATPSAKAMSRFREQLQDGENRVDWLDKHGPFFERWFRERRRNGAGTSGVSLLIIALSVFVSTYLV